MEKPSFNLIDKDWLFVRYADGQIKQVSLGIALSDTDIEDLAVPVYHGTACHPYLTSAYMFLPVIVMASCFKPDEFSAGNDSYLEELENDEIFTDTVKGYLEKYHDRFDLFGERPFLQDPELVDSLVDQEKYIPKMCYAAPSENGFMTGELNNLAVRNGGSVFRGFRMSMDELAYSLLYTQSIIQCPIAAHYFATLLKTASVFVFPKGKNLRETIRLNCVRLVSSSQPDEEKPFSMFDRPIWEFESPEQGIASYPLEEIGGNILFCTFFPAFPVLLGRELDEDGYVKQAAIGRKKDFCRMLRHYPGMGGEVKIDVAKAWLAAVESTYVMHSPWTYVYKKTEGKKGEEKTVYRYAFYNTDKSAHLLGIEITGKLSDREACIVLNPAKSKTATKIAVYYRIINVEHAGKRIQSGVLELNRELYDLIDEKAHVEAEKWAEIYPEMFRALRMFAFRCKAEHLTQELADWAERYFYETVLPEITQEEKTVPTEPVDTEGVASSPPAEAGADPCSLPERWFKDIRKEILSISYRALDTGVRESPVKCGKAYRSLLCDMGTIRKNIFGKTSSTSEEAEKGAADG